MTTDDSRSRGCHCWTDYRDGDPVPCENSAEKMVWREDGSVYYYCNENAEQAADYFPNAQVMLP